MTSAPARPAVALVLLAGLAVSASGQPADWLAAGGGLWNDPTHWSGGVVPNGGGFDTRIDLLGSPYTVTLNINAVVNSFVLDSTDATLAASGRTLSIGSFGRFDSGRVSFLGGGFSGGGTLENNASMDLEGAVGISTATFEQNGTLTVRATGSANARLTRTGDMTNAGTMVLTSTAATQAALSTTGTLTNAAGGEIRVEAGAGGTREITASGFLNNGTVNIEHSTSLNGVNGVYANAGQFNIGAGDTVTVSAGGVVTFNQSAGVLNNQGEFRMLGEVFNFTGGELVGNDLNINNSTVSNLSSNAMGYDLTGTTTWSGNVSSLQTVDVLATGAENNQFNAASFSNSGLIRLTSTAATQAELFSTGTVTNNADGVITIEQGAGGVRNIETAQFINNGTVNIDHSTSLNGVNGVYTNAGQFNIGAGDTVTVSAGGVVTFNQAAGVLNNQGVFRMLGEVFNFTGGELVGNDLQINNSTVNNASSNAMGYDLTGTTTWSGNVSSLQTVDVIATGAENNQFNAASFSNSGLIRLTSTAATQAELFSTGTVTNNADGVITIEQGAGGVRNIETARFLNDGTVNIEHSTSLNGVNGVYTNNADWNINAGTTTLNAGGLLEFVQAGGTLNNQGRFVIRGEVFTFTGGVLAGNDIEVNNASVANAAAGTMHYDATGTTTWSGNVRAGQTVDVIATGAENASMNAGSFSNSGIITLTSLAATSGTLLNSGTLTNNADGMLDIQAGAGGARNLTAAAFVNHGVVMVGANTALNGVNGTYRNEGDWTVAAGHTATLQAGGVLTFEQRAGTLTLDGGFTSRGERFVMTGGEILGNSVLIDNGELVLNGGGTAVFVTNGSVAFSGDVLAPQAVNIVASGAQNATLTGSFTNSGLVRLGSVAATSATLNGGSILNAAGGVIRVDADAGGLRGFGITNLVNDGRVEINATTSSSAVNQTWTNNGTLVLAEGAELRVFGAGVQTFINTGTVTGAGRLDNLDVDVFVNNGVFAPGLGAGTLEYEGAWTQSASGTLDIELAGRDAGEFDLLRVFGSASLDGELRVSVSGFIPVPADSFVILRADSLTGVFANAPTRVTLANGGSFAVVYDETAGTVTLTGYIPTPGSTAVLAAAGLLASRRRR